MSSTSAVAPPHSPRETVLIVEDDEMSARSVSRLVRSIGLVPRVASNAREALDALAYVHEMRALVADLKLPDGSGLWVAEAARRKTASLPIVILTATYSISIINHAFRVGARYLCKPLAARDIASLRLFLLGAPPEPVIERVAEWAQGKGLTPLDTELLTLALAGLGLPAIGERLGLESQLVSHHVERLLGVVGARDLDEVVRALRRITESERTGN